MIPPGVLCVDRVVPTGVFTSPAAGNVSGTVTVAINAADNDQVKSVQFRLDGTNLGAPVTAAPFQISHDTKTALNGSHTYSAVITDRIGNTTTVALNVTMKNAPVLTLVSPGNGVGINGNVAFTVNVVHYDASCSTQFYIDGSPWGAPQSGAGNLSPGVLDTHVLTTGWHSFNATATDSHGNTASIPGWNAYVGNGVPASGYLNWGDLWTDDGGWGSNRTSPPAHDERWGGSLAYWDVHGETRWQVPGLGAGVYPVLYLPGNPDPTHYQMRIQGYGTRMEGGTAGNVVRMTIVINGGENDWWVNGPSYGYFGLIWVNGGEGLQWLRWCDTPMANGDYTQGIQVYYDFVLKPGYNS